MNPTHENESRGYTPTAAHRDDDRTRAYDKDRDHGSRSCAQIERDIERTRSRIEMRAAQLEERLSPGQLMDRAMERVRGGSANEFLTNLGRDVRDNPLPLLITGVGLAWLMRADSGNRRDEARFDYEDYDGSDESSVKDSLKQGAERVREGAEHMRDRASRMGSSIKRGARSGREHVRDATHSVSDGLERVSQSWNRMLDEQPLLLGLLGLAAGAAIAAALPSTETEDEWMGEASDEAKLLAARKSRELAGDARHAVEERLGGDGHRSGGNGDAKRAQERSSSSSAPVSGTFGGAARSEPGKQERSMPSSPGFSSGGSESKRPGQGDRPFGATDR